VFRAVALSIVLAIAGTPSAALVCRIWCNPDGAATSGCLHEELFAAIVAGDDACRNTLVGTAFLPERVRRAASSSYAPYAVAPSHQSAAWMTDAGPREEVARPCSFESGPLETALRI
jgi:hypothetical protein